MITEEQMRSLFAEANPVPDPDALDLDEHDIAVSLATLERHSSDRAGVDETIDDAPGIGRQPWLKWVAAPATLVVVVVIAVLIQRAGDQAPATSAEQTIAEEFTASLERLDAKAVSGIVGSAGASSYLSNFGYDENNPGSIAGLWEWWAIHDMTFTFDRGCRKTPGQDGRDLTCDFRLENDWTRALGQTEMLGRIEMRVVGGQIVSLRSYFRPFDDFPAWDSVVQWLKYTHPEEFGTMVVNGNGLADTAKLTPESMALWRGYEPQIVDYLSKGS